MTQFFEPSTQIQQELNISIKKTFGAYFVPENIYMGSIISVDYDKDKTGKISAAVTLNWQSRPDFGHKTHMAIYQYIAKDNTFGREFIWYCTSGLPGD